LIVGRLDFSFYELRVWCDWMGYRAVQWSMSGLIVSMFAVELIKLIEKG